MTISITRKTLQSSIERVQDCCDSLGIRLGKGEDKAQKIACAVLNQPNWHVALNKASMASGSLEDSMAEVKAVCDKLLSMSFVSKLDYKSFITSSLKELSGLERTVDFVGSIGSVVRTMDMTTSHITGSISFGDRGFDEEESALLLLNYLFAERLVVRLPHLLPKDALQASKGLLDRLAINLKKSAKPIPCPDCGNHESDELDGFSFPNDGHYDYVVCQCCGRRTLEDDWNNPQSTGLDLDPLAGGHHEYMSILVSATEKLLGSSAKKAGIDEISSAKELALLMGSKAFGKVLERNPDEYCKLASQVWVYTAAELQTTFIPAADFKMQMIGAADGELVLFDGQFCLIEVEPRLGMVMLKPFLGSGSIVEFGPTDKAIRLGRMLK